MITKREYLKLYGSRRNWVTDYSLFGFILLFRGRQEL